jgi:hypothetical protein
VAEKQLRSGCPFAWSLRIVSMIFRVVVARNKHLRFLAKSSPNIPIRVPEHFLGREDSLADIETALSRYEGRVAITGTGYAESATPSRRGASRNSCAPSGNANSRWNCFIDAGLYRLLIPGASRQPLVTLGLVEHSFDSAAMTHQISSRGANVH